MTGTLYGVGLGPGDPELITLKAHRLVSTAKVIAYPAPDTGPSFARKIAEGFIPPKATEIPIVIPMRPERFPAQEVYDTASAEIGAYLEAGQDVVTLCEGDPLFYGSFMYLFGRLAPRAKVEVVPGVTSLTACASVAARPLCARNEVLSVLPAPLADDDLAARLATGGAFAILKVGRHLARLRKVIAAAGLATDAVYVAHASLAQQAVLPLTDAPEDAPYFSMILIPGRDPYVTP